MMSGRSGFRLSAQSSQNRDPLMHSAFSQNPTISHEDGVFMGLDPYASIRHPPQFVWQSLTPELRSEAIRRAQLIYLLRQVNPNLQLCRKSSSGPVLANTADKGIQVPDMRHGFANNRRYLNRSEVKRGAPFTAPGVRIQPRPQPPSPIRPAPPPEFSRPPPPNVPKKNTTLNVLDQRQVRTTLSPSQRTLQVTLKTTSSAEQNKSPERKNDCHKKDDVLKKDGEKVNGSKEEVVVKNKESSSGDEDSVVVVLNQPSSEQGLERKYGQFFCRRCLRGWSSRSVWCMRHTCKVYIKQTCNMCNKLVNPYLVCRLPPINSTRKYRK